MESFDKQAHWENIYNTKDFKDVSWYQSIPTVSLNFLSKFNVSKTAKIIDIGGGDSYLADNLIELGYQDITVLDISKTALDRAKQRLGEKSEKINWIISDVNSFQPSEQYDFWHDRAAFHFLTNDNEIFKYVESVNENIRKGGILIVGTFSEEGPKKCSGISIKQYSETELTETFKSSFEKIECFKSDHQTPFNTIQNFIFCSFRKL